MMRTTLALTIGAVLSLNVSAAAGQQAAPAPATQKPKTVVQLVRDAVDANDMPQAEKIVLGEMSANGTTPIAIEAFSWLGRGYLFAKNYDKAIEYGNRTYAIVEEQLKTRKLDDEPRLPIALGAAIEVIGQATAFKGDRSEAVLYLKRELDTYKTTSLVERLNKNINLISLEGTPAFPIDGSEWLSEQRASIAASKGKPVVLFLWAHWCGECKRQGPILEQLVNKYKSTGLTLIAPTKLYGYVAQRKPAAPAEEIPYIKEVRDKFYPWMNAHAQPVSESVFAQYGVSTTPTLVLIDREGKVSKFNPGELTVEELEPLIQKIITASTSSSK